MNDTSHIRASLSRNLKARRRFRATMRSGIGRRIIGTGLICMSDSYLID